MATTVLLRGWVARGAFGFLVVAGIVLLSTPRDAFPEWLFPRLTGFGCFLYAAVLVTLPMVFRAEGRTASQRHCLTRLQRFLAAGFLLASGGTLGLYELHAYGFDYDKVLHLFVPVLGTVGLMQFTRAWFGVPRRAARSWAVAIVLAGMLAWELLEFASDAVLGTSAFGQQGKYLVADTTLDFALGLAGIGIGLAWMASGPRRWACEPCESAGGAPKRRLA